MNPLRLRPLRPGDEEAAVRWAADEEFCRAADWTPNLAPERVREHWRSITADPGPDFLRLGIQLSGELVGHVDLAFLTATPASSVSASSAPAGGRASAWRREGCCSLTPLKC